MGFRTEGLLVDAVPCAGYDPDSYLCEGVEPTRLIGEGEVIDLGDRRFAVLHLPGYSPGGLGLWEAETGVLFTGDTLYDGLLLDTIGGAASLISAAHCDACEISAPPRCSAATANLLDESECLR